MADEKPVVAEKPEDEKEEFVTDPFGRQIRYVDEVERRKAALELSEEEAAKFIVTEATPASGGVFPPSALATSEESQKAEGLNQPDPQTPAETGAHA